MNFKIGPLSIDLRKIQNNESLLVSLDDIKHVNDDHIKYLKGLSVDELASRLNSVSLNNLNDLKYVQSCLEENGIVVLPDFIDLDIVNKCDHVVSDIKSMLDSFLRSSRQLDESENILWQKGLRKLKNYSELSGYDKTAVLVREGQDQGMVDVFNVDLAFPEANVVREAYESSGLKEVLSNLNASVNFKNLNFYLNRSVTSTRGFHADSYTHQLKAFIYLTDCTSLDDGPYTYVKKSQDASPYRRLNRQICNAVPNSTEAPIVNRCDIIPVIAKRGSLVISDQSGFHRGFPQKEGHERVISVMNIN